MHFYIMSQKYKGNFDQACQKLDRQVAYDLKNVDL